MVQKKGEGSNSNEIDELTLPSLRWCGNASTFPGAEPDCPRRDVLSGDLMDMGTIWKARKGIK